ncbi:MFS transporter [Actinophytocola sp.]|uniref:MFS transporter n=1 Tax=Actinophytocola sp. TaxID=1872138 RepID=UPI002D7E5DCB|nr:MFS transporter [Actinophytocola sp.]HET9137737.1 MFS transporter [Actinophytocola sp.]HEU5107223.1 MFS transporter [Micromonosporaceae bacterium]
MKTTPTPVRYLLGGVFINQMGAFVQTFLVLYLTVRGLSLGQAGAALTVYSAGAVLGTLLGGELTHRLGARTTIAVAMSASALIVGSVPFLSDSDRFGFLLAAVLLGGLATQSYRPAAAVLLSDLMPDEHRLMAFSMMRIAMNIGAAVGPLIAAGLILLDWDWLFWFDAITAGAYALLAIVWLPKTPPHAQESEPTSDSRSVYATMLRDGRFLLFLLSMLISAAIYVQYVVALPLKITSENHPAALYSVALATSSVILILCELKVTTYVRHWPPNVASALGNLVMGAGLAVFGLSTDSAALILIGIVVFVSGIMIGGPSSFAHPARYPAAVKARYVGAAQAMFGLGSALGPVLGVLAWDKLGNGIWLLCGIIGAIAALCALVGMNVRFEPEPAPEPAPEDVSARDVG